MSKYLQNLADIGYKDIALVGGKAASLGEMFKAGILVPEGFVITTKAYTDGMTDDLKCEINNAFDMLGVERVAVRSSAVAEDSKAASWAGQLDSYLNSTKGNLIEHIKKCWDSIGSKRAIEYADKNNVQESHRRIAVIVQIMVDSEISGVMFTTNPISQSTDEYVIEAAYGLCELLVQGEIIPELLRVDKLSKKIIERIPSGQTKMLVYKGGDNKEIGVPQDKMNKEIVSCNLLNQLILLANNIEELYKNNPQDIEWAEYKNKLYAVQSRPITTINLVQDENIDNNKIKLPMWNNVDLFYWGPSRAEPIFMSDFMSAVEQFFIKLSKDPIMPKPPETLVLFFNNKVVWLNDSKDFNRFVKAMFKLYEQRDKLDEDLRNWRKSMKKLDNKKSDANNMVEAWSYTLFPEFSLYGARDVITERLERFDQKARQRIWGTFTLPENSSFMTRIDRELLESNDPSKVALKYGWIEDGYSGTYNNAEKYFTNRLNLLNDNPIETVNTNSYKQKLVDEFGLTRKEVNELNLARQLAEMLDERKEWMMRTRRYITSSANQIEFGWLFKDGETMLIDEHDTKVLWDSYVNFNTQKSLLKGLVACPGGLHFMTGDVTVLTSPNDSVGNNQILVVPSTSPSYVPLMRKAKALITDHGGMMSHAAIVARELNLPCIVGTKSATKILKTGDKVILDLVKGIISN